MFAVSNWSTLVGVGAGPTHRTIEKLVALAKCEGVELRQTICWVSGCSILVASRHRHQPRSVSDGAVVAVEPALRNLCAPRKSYANRGKTDD